MIESTTLQKVAGEFQNKLDEGGSLDLVINKIQTFLLASDFVHDNSVLVKLDCIINKISVLKENEKTVAVGEIYKVNFGVVVLSFNFRSLENLASIVTKKIIESQSINEECSELTEEELMLLGELEPENLAIVFNENGIQLPSFKILFELLCRCGSFVKTLDFSFILDSVSINIEELDSLLFHCNSLEKLVVSNGKLFEKDLLEIIAHHCPVLTILQLTNCPMLTSKGINKIFSTCSNLKYFNLTSCIFLEEQEQNLVKPLSKLQLDIKDCRGVPKGLELIKE